ncbi:Microtubule-destabilizing protein 60, partial [Linum perenne]
IILELKSPEFQHLIKPPVKESTKPIDLTLHSDVRAEERAEFNQQVLEKLSLYEKYKMERERLQKVTGRGGRSSTIEKGAYSESSAAAILRQTLHPSKVDEAANDPQRTEISRTSS